MSNVHSVIDAPAPGTRGILSFSARLRWVLVIFLLGWLLFVGILTWFFVRRSLFQQVDTVAINQLQAAAASLDDRLDRLETLAESIARALAIQWETNAVNPPASAAGLLNPPWLRLPPKKPPVCTLRRKAFRGRPRKPYLVSPKQQKRQDPTRWPDSL